jgi:CubicO group peptidase (beta-lactamase class C family)
MRMYEKGLLDIDAPISRYVDPVLKRLNGTTMQELWNGDPLVHNVTARLVMGMRAGLHDYNDEEFAAWTYDHPTEYFTPFDSLHQLKKTWVCDPGKCGRYASPGYELLGLALVQVMNKTNWDDLDQMAVLEGLRPGYEGKVAFPDMELCSAVNMSSHQYRLNTTVDKINGTNSSQVVAHFYDILNTSCLNGWTEGNIISTPGAIADWHWDLFHLKLVNASSHLAMCNGIPLTQGWSPGLRYNQTTNQLSTTG